jgi:hypothetical protein
MPKTAEIIGQQALILPEVAAGGVAVEALTNTPDQPAVSPHAHEYTDPAAFDARVDRIVDTRNVGYATARAIAAAGLTAPLRPSWMLDPSTAANNATRAEETRQMLAKKGMPATNHRRDPLATMPRRRRLYR